LALYLVDEPFADIALAYASFDPQAKIVLLNDAVYSTNRGSSFKEVYALADDVKRRGLFEGYPTNIRLIGYDKLVEMMESDKVANFL